MYVDCFRMETNQQFENIEKQCIVHYKSSKDEHLVTLQNYESWKTMLEAAKLRNFKPILDIANKLSEKETPTIYYHRNCRSLFTMKRNLDTLKRKSQQADEASENSCTSKRPSRRSSSEARVYDQICIFCNKDKFLKGSKSREKLTQAVQLRADQTLRECATRKGDDKILSVTSRDMVAAEVHYHVSCYKDYTRIMKKSDYKADGDEIYKNIERQAYEKLFKYIRTDIIPQKMIVQVGTLVKKLESFMLDDGVTLLKDSSKKHIRRNLEAQLGKSVDIFPDDKGKLLMVPDSVSLRDVILENQILERELKVWRAKSTNFNNLIDHTSSHIRIIIKEKMPSTSWPIHPSDVKGGGHISIQEELEQLLVGLLTGNPDIKVKTQTVTTLVQSFSQDIICAVTWVSINHQNTSYFLMQ